MEIKVWAPHSEHLPPWKRLPGAVCLGVSNSDWIKDTYVNNVLRLALSNTRDGCRAGHLKLVRGPNEILLFAWSPPAEFRGMPLDEFEDFLEKMVAHPGKWQCRVTSPDGTHHTVDKGRGSNRNMYDICSHFIQPEVARYDASYAEVCTDYGPAHVFFSHVWSCPAYDTLQSVKNFRYARTSVFKG